MFLYPWGDMHSLNLGWFLLQFKDWVEKIQEYLDNGGGTDENLANVIAPVFNSANSYSTGDYVLYNDILYKANQNVSPGTWNPEDWDRCLLVDEMGSGGGSPGIDNVARLMIAGQYSNSYGYQKYAIARYNDKLWMCNTNLPSSGEAWNPSHWDEITVGAGLTGLRRSVDSLASAITLNPTAKMRSVGNSIMTGSVWVNESPDHLTSYSDSPYGNLAGALGVRQENVVHTMLSGSGMCSDIGNGSFYDYIVTNSLSLSGFDYLVSMLWTSDMYTTPIGKANDTAASNTIAGKVIGIVEYLRNHFPSVQFILLGVPPANYAIAGANVFTDLYTNGASIKQCDALFHTLAEMYHFTFIDWEQLLFATYWQSFTDGQNVHPNNDKIYRLCGEYLAANYTGQKSSNDGFLKVYQFVSDNITGTAAWHNLFSNPNPLIDENMIVVDLVPRYRAEVKTAVPAWRVVAGNVQVYAAFSESGTTFNVTLARGDSLNANGFINLPTIVRETLIAAQEIDTTASQIINTTSGRKFSDYSLIHLTAGGGASDIRIEGTYTPSDFAKTIHLTGLSGTNLESASGLSCTIPSDTSMSFYSTGQKLFKYVFVEGLRLF